MTWTDTTDTRKLWPAGRYTTNSLRASANRNSSGHLWTGASAQFRQFLVTDRFLAGKGSRWKVSGCDSIPYPLERIRSGCRRMSTTSPAPISGLLIPLILTAWISYMLGVIDKDTDCFACNTKGKLMAKFKDMFEDHGDKVKNACARCWIHFKVI